MAENFFFVVSELNGKVLDIHGGSKDQGAHLIVWDFHGGENQRFRFNERGFIISAHSGLVLDIEGGVEQGRKIIQWPAHGGPNQLWRLHRDGTIRLAGHNLVLDIEGGNPNSGAQVIAWTPNGGPNQRWRIVTQYN